MGYRTVNLKPEVYDALTKAMLPKESYSDAVKRLMEQGKK